MEPADYEAWLAGAVTQETPARAGEALYMKHGCGTCHGSKAPTLAGLAGRKVQLSNGQTIIADESYIRESILNSTAKIVAGYPPTMPSFQGQLSEEQLMQLIAYIKSLSEPPRRMK
jgi:cytochrome c oxidase subunit 2